LPKALPAQVVAPQEPSVETFLAGAGTGAGDVEPPPEQVPNAELQPVPQWSVELPHQPYCEQQLPNVEPAHVALPDPHEPSVETGVPVVGGGVVEPPPPPLEVRYQFASGSPMHSPMVTPR
jgi:hypothetical protein